MESINYTNPDPGLLVSSAPDWELGYSINGVETTALSVHEQSVLQTPATQTMDLVMNGVEFTSALGPSLTAAPRELAIEPDSPKRISRDDWEKHRKAIEAEYPSKTLTELREFMVVEHGFVASTQQWKKKLAEWRLSKNLRPRETRFIRKRAHRRLVDEGKATQFSLGGQLIPMDKVKRHLQDPPNDPSSPTGSTPTGLSCLTYRSPILASMRLNPPSNLRQGSNQEEYPRSTPSIGVTEIGPIIPALWEGHDIDHFLAVARDASSCAASGDYLGAKAAFMDALEGLAILLNPVHAQTISVLENFVRAAVHNDDLPTALAKLHASYNAHKDLLDDRDKRTWRSLARLGSAYFEAKEFNRAYNMLLNARQGLLANAIELDPKSAYLSTRHLTRKIIEILRRQGDFDAAEEEYVRLITQLERFGEAYLPDLAFTKYELAHLYILEVRRQSATNSTIVSASPNQAESLIQESMEVTKALKNRIGYLDCLSAFCWLYETTNQRAKLMERIPDMEKELEDTFYLDALSPEQILNFKYNMARYYSRIGMYDKTESLHLWMQDEIERTPHLGPRSKLALGNLLHLCNVYFAQGKRDRAVVVNRKARDIAREVLPQDRANYTNVESAIETGLNSVGCLKDFNPGLIPCCTTPAKQPNIRW